MNFRLITWLLYAGLTLSYAAWQGNSMAHTETLYRNSQGVQVWPAVTRNMNEVNTLGSAQYYTGSDGQKYTDIVPETHKIFSWEEFFKVSTFGFGFALIIYWIVHLVNKLSQKNP